MHQLLKFSRDTITFPWRAATPIDGLHAAIGIAIALSVGHLTNHDSAGAIAAAAVYTIGFAAFHRALASALLSMGLLTLGVASATLAGSLAASWTPLVLLVVTLAALNYGMLSFLGPTAGWMGMQCGVFVIIASYFPLGVHYAVGRTLMVLTGGALQMIVYALFHFTLRSEDRIEVRTLATRFQHRTSELIAQFRNDLHFRGETAWYTLRLIFTLVLGTALYRYFHLRNGYWVPMTALLVIRPSWTGTFSRGIARMAGTVAGAGIALLLARTLHPSTTLILALVLLSAWASYATQAVNYAFFSLFLTLYIVFLFRWGGFSQTSAAHIRLFNTVLGGGIALLVDGLWSLTPAARNSQYVSRSYTPVQSSLP